MPLWASGHALAAHVRSCGSTDIMNSQLELSQQWGHGALYRSHSFILILSRGRLPLSVHLFSPSHLHYFCFVSFLLFSVFSSSTTSFLFVLSSTKKKFGPFACFPHQSLPPYRVWIVFYLMLTRIRRIFAPSSLAPFSPFAPLFEISVIKIKVWQKKKDNSMLLTSLPKKELIKFCSISLWYKKAQRRYKKGGWGMYSRWIEWCWHGLQQSPYTIIYRSMTEEI